MTPQNMWGVIYEIPHNVLDVICTMSLNVGEMVHMMSQELRDIVYKTFTLEQIKGKIRPRECYFIFCDIITLELLCLHFVKGW